MLKQAINYCEFNSAFVFVLFLLYEDIQLIEFKRIGNKINPTEFISGVYLYTCMRMYGSDPTCIYKNKVYCHRKTNNDCVTQ